MQTVPDPRLLFTLPGVPRRGITRAAGCLARLPIPRWLRAPLWSFLARRLGIGEESLPEDFGSFRTFLDLFTRPLPGDQRPLPAGDHWLSPADGRLVAVQSWAPEGSFLIKGCPYSTEDLLPGSTPQDVADTCAYQVYLAPRDYHRFHAPCDLTIESAWTLPGDLLPVDPALLRPSHQVLTRNRRILLHCRDIQDRWLGIMFVGALNVGGMRFTFDQTLGCPPLSKGPRTYTPNVSLDRGQELGQFEFGSTILLFAPGSMGCSADLGDRLLARTEFLTHPLPGPL